MDGVNMGRVSGAMHADCPGSPQAWHLCSTQWASRNQGQEDVRQKLITGLHLFLFDCLQTLSKLPHVFGEAGCAFCLCQSCSLVRQGLRSKEKLSWSTAPGGDMSSLHLLIHLPSGRVRQDNSGTLQNSSAVHGHQA